MSRYLGPIHKKSKNLVFSILENNKEFKKKKKGLGKQKWKRKTEFGLQLQEKQKLKFLYQISEKQLHNTFKKVLKKVGNQNENLIVHLEKRLDNMVFRLGYALTRRESRQMVNHGHILVNHKKVDIPSYLVKVGDTIMVKKEKVKKSSRLKSNLESRINWSFLKFDPMNFAGKVLKEPDVEELSLKINTALIVEYYNRFA